MLNTVLAGFYERDIRKLIDEINLFGNEEDLWRVAGSVKNPAGNLALHIIGGMNHKIGTVLSNTGYIRNRDAEFSSKGTERNQLVAQLEDLITLINKTLTTLSTEAMEAEYPAFFDKPGTSTSYVLVQLLAHLNYHLGQVNYLRRVFE